MLSVVHHACIPKGAVVDRVRKHQTDRILGDGAAAAGWVATFGGHSLGSEELLQAGNGLGAICKSCEGFGDNWTKLAVDLYCLGATVVEVAARSRTRVLAPKAFLGDSTFGNDGKVVRVSLALGKLDPEYAFSLRVICEPEDREAEILDDAGVEPVDEITSIFAVSSQAIWVIR